MTEIKLRLKCRDGPPPIEVEITTPDGGAYRAATSLSVGPRRAGLRTIRMRVTDKLAREIEEGFVPSVSLTYAD